MRVVLFGATGMLGAGALIECLGHPDVEAVLAVGRRVCGVEHEKLTEVVLPDLSDLSEAREALRGYDACFYCLGVSSAGMSEEAYERVTVGLTVVAAEALLEANPGMTFCFISGAGTDASEEGRVMWARVKGKAENRVREMGFGAVWIFRPGFVRPVKGVRSRTRLYNVLYAFARPLLPLLMRVPGLATTSERVGLALIRAAREGAPKPVLENDDINGLAEAEAARLS